MNKVKMLLGYLFGFISSLIFVFLIILIVFKFTIFNQKYVLKILEKNNYYENIYNDIKKDFSNSLMSSGVDDSVLSDLYSSSDVERDIKSFIASIYSGSKYEVDSSQIRVKLNDNIDKYLSERNLKVNSDSLKTYVDGIISVYEKQIGFYGYLDGFISKFVKACRYTDLFIGVLLILFAINLFFMRYVLHVRYSGVTFMASGLMLIYLKCFVYDLIDFKNITIISDDFSTFIRVLFDNIGNYVLIISIICIGFGLLLNIFNSMMKVKRKKRV